MLITWICRSAAELQPQSQRPQASSLRSLSQWQSNLTAIVRQMEEYRALADEPGSLETGSQNSLACMAVDRGKF